MKKRETLSGVPGLDKHGGHRVAKKKTETWRKKTGKRILKLDYALETQQPKKGTTPHCGGEKRGNPQDGIAPLDADTGKIVIAGKTRKTNSTWGVPVRVP